MRQVGVEGHVPAEYSPLLLVPIHSGGSTSREALVNFFFRSTEAISEMSTLGGVHSSQVRICGCIVSM